MIPRHSSPYKIQDKLLTKWQRRKNTTVHNLPSQDLKMHTAKLQAKSSALN